jgi:hypothetical protein
MNIIPSTAAQTGAVECEATNKIAVWQLESHVREAGRALMERLDITAAEADAAWNQGANRTQQRKQLTQHREANSDARIQSRGQWRGASVALGVDHARQRFRYGEL